MTELAEKWDEATLRQWAIDHAKVEMVQARQVLSLLDEVVLLRSRVKELETMIDAK